MTFIILLLCIFSLIVSAKERDLSVGFILYRDPIPEEVLYSFDWLVVDPDNPHVKRLMDAFYLKNRRAKLIAYVSVGELEPYREYFKEAKKEWILGENKVWNSFVVDVRRDDYLEFLLERVFARLGRFDGFFLDTLDSHQLFLKGQEELSIAQERLAKLVNKLRERYPDKLILLNRGFEIMERVRDKADAIVAESLLYGISHNEKKSYIKMKEEDTRWLLERLNRAKELGYRVIVIDYVDPSDREKMIQVARQIRSLGFIPYVSDRYLRTVGVSNHQLIPRRILLLYSRNMYRDPSFTRLNRFIQPWLEYLGYVPVLMEAEKALQDSRLNYFMADVYAGIVVDASGYEDPDRLFRWLLDKKREGLKIFFLDSFVFPAEDPYLKEFSLKNVGYLRQTDPYSIQKSTFPFAELQQPPLKDMPMLVPEVQVEHYVKAQSKGVTFYPLAILPWGGYALSGSFIAQKDKHNLFVIDPVELLSKVFKPLPLIPDTTTENGRRILTVHMDGDAFFGNADFNPAKNVAEILRDEIIKRYPVPHTISVIEGEIAPYGLYPEKSQKLEEIARSIFALENVEAASHTFSHPFRWQELEAIAEEELPINPSVQYNLPIKDYKFDLRREIFGSIEYINKRLLPEGKKVKVFLWSGDTNPSEEAIRLTYEAGVYNVNGGYTWINRKEPFLTYISPMGVNKGEYFQIYAPIMNENVYTNLWTDYYGYIRVIDTFEMTESPYRIKPIGIYYHAYSAQKVASLSALRKVYEWALSQKPNPVYLSEFAQKVLEFRNFALLRHIEEEGIRLRGGGNLRTLRVEGRVHVDLEASQGVVGYVHHRNTTYVHLDPSGDYKIVFSQKEPTFRLVSSNGRVVSFKKREGNYTLELDSHVPLEAELVARGCTLQVEPKGISVERAHDTVRIRSGGKHATIQAHCKE